MNQTLELLRAANVALLSVALLTLIVFLTDTWRTLSWGRRISMAAIRLLLLAGVIGSAIKYATHAPVDVSILFVTASATGVIVGQWLARNDRPTTPPPDALATAVFSIVDAVETNPTLPPCEHPGCIGARIELRHAAAKALNHHHEESA